MMASPRLPETIQTLPDALAYWAEETPDAPALIVPGQPVITYADLYRGALALAERLGRAGVGQTVRVVLLIPEGPDLAVALLATMSAAIAIPLNASLTASELTVALDGLNAAVAVVTPALSAAAGDMLDHHGLATLDLDLADPVRGSAATGHASPAQPVVRPGPDDIAVVSQTSGTTGRPKRVPRDHWRVVESGRRHRDRFGLDGSDRALAVAPMTLSLGITALLHSIAAGSSLILPISTKPSDLWDAIEVERPTWMHASAGFLELLARLLRADPARPAPSSLRFVRVTAAAIAPETCDELAGRLGTRILPGYSTSETGLIATAMPPPAAYKPGSTGKPIQEIWIVDGDTVLGPREEGEILLRGSKVLAGYLDDPELNAAAFTADGWLRTGDVGYLDEDGFLFLTGRLKELINRGGAKISPNEVDSVLLGHSAVVEAATFGVPDGRLGEDIVAAVVAVDGAAPTPRELRGWMLDRLAPHKVPRRIWFVDELPRTPTGKVQRGELARRWQEEHP
jgi:acyl-CoA synthetase (AMP-forming)/AMP-acid ligase II